MNIKFDFSLFIAQSIKTIRLFGLILCIFFVSRLILLLRFGNFSEFQTIKSDVLDSFLMGARFDTLIIGFGLLPIILINWLSGINNIKIQKNIQYFSVFYGVLAVFVFTLGLMIDGQFYTYFQTHLNIIIVGLWEDDTKNILRSVWSDHPIIILSTIWLFSIIGGFFIIKKVFLSDKKYLFLEKKTNNLWKKIAFFLVFHLFYFIGLRGSVGEFTLRVDHSTISENAFLNYLTTNGFFSLKEALEEGATPIFTKQAQEKIWKNYGFNSKQEAEKAFFGDSLANKFTSNATNNLENLYQTTPQNDFLAQNPPNVIFVMMESMGKHYFDLNSPTLNTLGELEKHLPDLFVFENFTSNQNYTIPSLTELMINIPIHNITQTSHRFKPFDASVALPFVKAGYETGYFTSGEVGWQYLHQFLPAQNFQRLVGNATLKKQNKDIQSSDWGVFDEHLFDFTFQELQKNQQKKEKKPQFYFLLTTTNHTPFAQPSNYKKLPINFSDSLKQNFMCDLSLAEGSFSSYQYASDCLGKFLTKIKSSNLAQNTIIVAVGDHNNLIVFPYKNEDLMRKRSVAMMMYVPEKYQQKIKDTTNNSNKNFTKRFGSHKDIFPTIFNLSLSKAKFMSIGNNLFDTTKNDNNFFAINTNETVFSYIGAVNKKDYFKWDRNSNNQYQLKKITNSPTNPALSALDKRKQGYLALLHYYFNENF